MTMVAAFRSMGVPCLIGDFLLTRSDGAEVGARKKVSVLFPNLAIGWSGVLITAQAALRGLLAGLGGKEVTRDTVYEVLKSDSMAELQDDRMLCHLIGWVVDSDGSGHCFRWNSAYSREVYEGDWMYDGSGECDAAAILREGLRMSEGEEPTEFMCRSALHHAAGRFMARELLAVPDRSDAYGLAFEAVIYGRSGFEYLSDVLHYECQYSFNADGAFIDARLNPRMIRLRHIGWATEIAAIHHFPNGERNVQINYVTDVFAVPIPREEATRRAHARMTGGFDWTYSYGVEDSRFLAPGFASRPVHALRPREVQTLHLDANSVSLNVAPEMLEHWFRIVRNDMAAASTTQGDA